MRNLKALLLTLCLLSSLAAEPRVIDLEEAECLAMTHNRRILGATQEVRQAYLDKLIALANLLPRVTYLAQWNAAEHLPLEGLTKTLWASKFGISQPLFNTELYYNFTGSTISFYIEKADYLELENDLLLLVRQLYYRLILDYELIAVAEHNVRLLQETLRQYREKLEIGLATAFDVTQQEVAVLRAISRYYERINAWEIDRNDLVKVLGMCPKTTPAVIVEERKFPLETIEKITETISATRSLDLLLESVRPEDGDRYFSDDPLFSGGQARLVDLEEICRWDQLALQHRPSILRSRLEIDLAENSIRRAKGRYLPDVTAFACYQANPPEELAASFVKHYWWNGGLRLEWTLFDSFARELGVAKARADKRGANYFYEEAVIVAKRDVRNALDTLVNLGFEYNAAVKNVEAAEINLSQADDMYHIGLIDTLNYLDAVQRLFEAQSQEKVVAFLLIDTYYQLRRAVGIDAIGRLICYGKPVG